MNVIIANEQQGQVAGLDIDVIKSITGSYSAVELVEMFKNFLRKDKMDNLQTVKCIMEHYRNLVKPKIVSDNFWSIIAIAISVLLAFVTKDGFDFKSFESALPYLISFIFITLIILFSIKQFSGIKTFLKGEEGMYERLEVIFSESYIDSLKEKDTSKKKRTIKIKNKKSKNTPLEEKSKY